MQIKVLLPTETLTVDLEELKELVRQGVVQPSTLIEVADQRGKAKNIPALKPLFAELDAQTQEPPKVTPSTEPQTPSTFDDVRKSAAQTGSVFIAVVSRWVRESVVPKVLAFIAAVCRWLKQQAASSK